MKYKIGDLGFNNKNEIKEYYQNILRSYVPGDVLSPKDFEEVYELLKYHHGYDIKIEGGVRAIKVDWMQYGTRCFHIIRPDGSMIDFSYIECLKGIKRNGQSRTEVEVL